MTEGEDHEKTLVFQGHEKPWYHLRPPKVPAAILPIELRRRPSQRAASSVIMDASDILALPVGALARVIARGDVSGESVLDSACSARGMEHPARDTGGAA